MLVAGGFEPLVETSAGRADSRIAPGLAAALIVHMALLAAAVVIRFPPAIVAPSDDPIAISIVAPDDLKSTEKPPPGVLSAPAKPAATPATVPGMISPSTMLSARTLADPRSRQARAALATFASSERIVQLCNLEAMDQIHAWRATFRPERIVAYARKAETMLGDTIEADGAAFRSRDQWYDLKFTCRLSRDRHEVVAFAFAVGEPVPQKQWEDLGLPAGGDED